MGRVTYRYTFIVVAALLLLMIASIPADVSTPAAIRISEQNTEPILWMYTSGGFNEAAGDLFVKREGEDAVKVAAQVLIGSHLPYNNGSKLLYLDDLNRLYLLQADAAAELIAGNIPMFQYGFSSDGSKVYYKTTENKLFVKETATLPILIAGQVNYYRTAPDGNPVYFIDTNHNLFLYSQSDPMRKIAPLVTDFSASDDGTSLIYLDQAGMLYLVNSDQSPVALTDGETKVEQSEISADGSIITYTANYQEEGNFSDLYVYLNTGEGLRSIKAAEEVTDFHTAAKGNHLYYLNRNKQFFQYDMMTGNQEMISEDTVEFKISPAEETIMFLAGNNDLYLKQKLSKAVKIAPNASNPDIVDDHNVIFTDEDTLFYYKWAGQVKMKISGSEHYAIDTDHLYYVSNHRNIKVIPAGTEEGTLWLNNIDKFTRIYTNHHLLYKRLFDLNDLVGDWWFSDGNGNLNFSSITDQKGLLTIQEDDGKRSIPYIIQFVSETKVHLLLLGEGEGEMTISKSGEDLTLEINGKLRHLIRAAEEVRNR